ncbi:MAG: type VI secretion system contractile sheath small subunit [Crocinitomicaceae bacterium]|nr:type VI secretion system contractile sheath small subunit [Crocinitomicaceae bacterium]
MSMYNYGIGGNEVKKDASEAISNIPSNRTLLIQKLTNETPVTPEAIYKLETVEQVFEKFAPKLEIEFQDENGSDVKETMNFKNLGDFNPKAMKENSAFLNKLNVEKEQNTKITRQLTSNRALKKALDNPETRTAIIETLEASLAELTNK